MNEIPGNRHLSGTWGEMWVDGFKIAEMNKISVKVTLNKEEVQTGMDVDTKIVGAKGEGTVSLIKTYSRFDNYRRLALKGEDVRTTVIAKLKDPDATGGQTERYQISNVSFSEYGFEWEKGTVVKQEIPFTFTPSNMIILDEITVE